MEDFQILLQPDYLNNLKIPSVIKIDRIATVKQNKLAAVIGKLNRQQLENFKHLLNR
jgi:hypothetical protein